MSTWDRSRPGRRDVVNANASRRVLFSLSPEDARILERHLRAPGDWRTRPLADRWWPPFEAGATDAPEGLRRGVREGVHKGFRRGIRPDSDPPDAAEAPRHEDAKGSDEKSDYMGGLR
jgi:hypothetical protein